LGNQIFKSPILNLAPKGCINLHTALLPKYRGLMPTFWVMKNNEKKTGVSVFFVDEGIDSGPIIIQEKLEIGNFTQEQLIKRTKKIGMELISKSIDLIQALIFSVKNDVLNFNIDCGLNSITGHEIVELSLIDFFRMYVNYDYNIKFSEHNKLNIVI
jgi:formyltetrahydrofolate hydrolase